MIGTGVGPATLAGTASLLVAGIGEMVVSGDADATLVAYGLGSCVALAAWDPVTRVGGLAHFMLPSGGLDGGPPVKFIDTGLGVFFGAFKAAGGNLGRARLRAAGGAAMLSIGSGTLEIGRRNGEALNAALAGSGLRLAASALGGTSGRTVQLQVASGRLLVKSLSTFSEL